MPEGFKTREQLIARALGLLGAVGAGQAPSAEDVEMMDDLIDPLISMLPARGISEAIDPDEVPNEIFLPFAVMLADVATTDFGVNRGTPDDPNSFAAKAGEAERQIRAIQSTRPTYAPAQVEYF